MLITLSAWAVFAVVGTALASAFIGLCCYLFPLVIVIGAVGAFIWSLAYLGFIS